MPHPTDSTEAMMVRAANALGFITVDSILAAWDAAGVEVSSRGTCAAILAGRRHVDHDQWAAVRDILTGDELLEMAALVTEQRTPQPVAAAPMLVRLQTAMRSLDGLLTTVTEADADGVRDIRERAAIQRGLAEVVEAARNITAGERAA